ncbi:nitroreductase family protein [Thalassobaculum salexigens]|uniref:nitroreductase family protein n=1 Tax=Thalassobaculum salexigens TaxID=455360 RepID=UPI00248D449D|nr:nitroreductase family protein [Thalassobaculum salexigens]
MDDARSRPHSSETHAMEANAVEANAVEDWQRILGVLADRRSCRDFDGTQMDRELLAEIVRDGMQAPSSCNQQQWHFVIVDDRDLLQRCHDISGGNHHFAECSALIYLCFQKGWTHGNFSVVQSVAGACYHMMLSAHLRGYDTIWNAGIGDNKALAELFGVPPIFEITGALAIGRAKPSAPAMKAPRRPFEEVHSWNGFARPAHTVYPVKPAKAYPYFEITNPSNPFAVWDPRGWSWAQLGDFRGYAVWAKSPLAGVYVSRRQGEATAAELDLLPDLKAGAKVAELMPWGGTYSAEIRRRLDPGVDFHLAELSQGNLTFILERLKREGFALDHTHGDRIDGPTLPYADGSLDAVILPQVLEQMPQPQKVLDEVRRVLKPGGAVIASVRNLDSDYGDHWSEVESLGCIPNQGPFTPLSAETVRGWMAARFTPEVEQGIGTAVSQDATIVTDDNRTGCRLYAGRWRVA